MSILTPNGVADYFESLKKVQRAKFEEQLGKSFSLAKKSKKRNPIGFDTRCVCEQSNQKQSQSFVIQVKPHYVNPEERRGNEEGGSSSESTK